MERDEIADTLADLGFPEFIVRLNRGDDVMTPFLRARIHAPFEFYTFTNHYPGSISLEPDLIPIWEQNGDVLYGFANDGTSRFIEQYYELPADQFTVIATSYQHFLVTQFADFYSFSCSPAQLQTNPLATEIELLDFHHDELLRAAILEQSADPASRHSFDPEDVAESVLRQLQ